MKVSTFPTDPVFFLLERELICTVANLHIGLFCPIPKENFHHLPRAKNQHQLSTITLGRAGLLIDISQHSMLVSFSVEKCRQCDKPTPSKMHTEVVMP